MFHLRPGPILYLYSIKGMMEKAVFGLKYWAEMRSKSHGKSAAQVIIRWHIQKGFCVVPGSSNPKHIQENIEVFDFELSPEEMAKMASLNQEKRYFTMNYQQIKAWMENYELWD